MYSNTVKGIIVEKFNEQYKYKFKNIKKFISDMNIANEWDTRLKVLKTFLRDFPQVEFTLLRGRYRAKILVYYTISNRFTTREVNFLLNDLYTFVNGKYILVDFKDNILNGNDIFEYQHIYFILELEDLEDEIPCKTNYNEINLKESPIHVKDEDLIFEDDGFVISENDEAIILDENLTEEQIEEFLKNFK